MSYFNFEQLTTYKLLDAKKSRCNIVKYFFLIFKYKLNFKKIMVYKLMVDLLLFVTYLLLIHYLYKGLILKHI